jgi:cathepsin D
MTMQGSTISLGSSNAVAVDTGTTLIGGPASIIASIYAAIPGSAQMTGSYANYYQYPCSTSINFDMTFSGYTIHITDADFNLGRYSSDTTMCTGAAFIQTLPSGSPVQWIVGDTALKNVYSVYRYSPAAVGFANLAGSVQAQSQGQSTTIPVVGSSLAGVAPLTGAGTATMIGSTAASANSTIARGKSSGSMTSATSTISAVASSNTASGAADVVTATTTVQGQEASDASPTVASTGGASSGALSGTIPGIAAVLFGAGIAMGLSST